MAAGQAGSPPGWPAKHQLGPEEDQLGDQLDQIKPVKTNKPSEEQARTKWEKETEKECVCNGERRDG